MISSILLPSLKWKAKWDLKAEKSCIPDFVTQNQIYNLKSANLLDWA